MAVRREKDKRTWEYEYRVTDPVTGKVTHRHRRGFGTKREAEDAMMQAKAKEKHTTAAMSLRDVVKMYIDGKATDLQTNTRQSYNAALTRLDAIAPRVLDMQYADITPDVMISLRKAIGSTDYATRTKNEAIRLVKSACRYVADLYDVQDVSRRLTSLPKTDEEELTAWDHATWTVDQFNSMLAVIPESDSLMRALFVFLYWSGCRRGEALALCPDDLRHDTHSVYIHRSRDTNGVHRTKTRSSIRLIPLDDDTWQTVASVAAQRAPGEYLWPYHCASPGRAMTRYAKLTGLPPLTIHGLRHSHATLLINSGANIASVSHRLGHSSIIQTLKTYTHLMDSADDATMQIIANVHGLTNKQ